MEFLILSLCITLLTHMIEDSMLHENLDELMKLEEVIFLAEFYQGVQKC